MPFGAERKQTDNVSTMHTVNVISNFIEVIFFFVTYIHARKKPIILTFSNVGDIFAWPKKSFLKRGIELDLHVVDGVCYDRSEIGVKSLGPICWRRAHH